MNFFIGSSLALLEIKLTDLTTFRPAISCPEPHCLTSQLRQATADALEKAGSEKAGFKCSMSPSGTKQTKAMMRCDVRY
jgi:hypothetical protein